MASPAVAEPATLETPPAPISQTEPSVIHGLDQIVVPAEAVGAAPDQPAGATPTTTEQVTAQPAPTGEAQPVALSVEERIKADPEFAKYLEERDKSVEAERARAVTLARQKWDNDVLRAKLTADRKQQEEAVIELAHKADAGDADALAELGKTVVAQVMHKTSTAEVYQQLYAEAEAAAARVAGENPQLAQQLSIQNYGSLADWAVAIADAKVSEAKLNFQRELDKLSEAKAADLVAARRANLPNPDLTAPVAAGGTPRLWNSLAEAAELFATEQIPADQYELAKAWFADGRLPAGMYGE